MAKKGKNTVNARRKIIASSNPKSPISEQYRTIRTNIQFSVADKEMRSIIVTSSGPGEGKSTTAANLAVVFAQQGKHVLLIDADLRKPTVHYTFNLPNTYGMTNVLTKRMVLSEAVVETEEKNLYVLSSGPIPPNPAELLGSKAMKDLLEELHETFDVIVMDTPPVLAVTDATILSNICDGTILVVSSGKTETEQALKAKELLGTVNSNLLGVVLNNKKVEKNNYYYYYGN
ncbi:CpsD/CapB family tyrosine-protein kinase [Bacillus massiliglaciei]|uniref:CpsD/CapB family tyrosine-protein kinase n=1 Tax=Bacillus massiliglaciei TaxID=1816693 RepID=UPI000AB58F93|nr:CpsD/CapB family tyrosine-protein kinase [Bacillus massiliglaciei]